MQSYSQSLVRSLLATLGGLPLGCCLVAIFSGVYLQLTSLAAFTSISPGWAAAALFSTFALIYGLLPALVLGASMYAFLLYKGRANYLTAILIGMLPGLALTLFDLDFALFFLVYGVSVAGCTHFIASKFRARTFANAA